MTSRSRPSEDLMITSLRVAAVTAGASFVLTFASLGAAAQQPTPTPPKTDSASRDSLRRAVLQPVNIIVTPAARSEPVGATHVDAATIQLTPSHSPDDLLRQTAGLEVHEQGQGPGFSSDASLRGFSSVC